MSDAGQTAFHFACRWAEKCLNFFSHSVIMVVFLFLFFAVVAFLPFVALSSGKETSTLCIKWCSMELTCASETIKEKPPCIMQLLEETCRWNVLKILHHFLEFLALCTLTVFCFVFFISSVAMHYLWETGMLRFSDTDMFRVTPLHLAASTGNIEVVCYLLKDQVWNVFCNDLLKKPTFYQTFILTAQGP